MSLTINDMVFGECENYEQNREGRVWVFHAEKCDVIVPFDSIRFFHSANGLELEVMGKISVIYLPVLHKEV